MANRFLSNIRINDAYTFPASDGSSGQVITTDGAGNLSFAESGTSDAASVIYRDNFTGDGSTVAFDLQNSITDEDQTQIYIDGVYQEKDTYSVSGSTITFTTAPISGHSIEVISISAINTGPTIIYQDNFTGNGSATDFTLAQVIDNEVKTFVFLNGVYQFKGTYSVDSTTLSFDTAPANGVDIEVISIASATQADSLQAGAVIVPVKNTHTASISKGTPVYITGNVGASERLQIAPADASNSAKMPAAGLLLTTLAVNAEGYAITGGYLRNITTDTIDGTSTTSNDTVYVKAGGGLTMTKPTGSNLIQNIAKVARSSGGSSGSLLVSSILRTNDVPNLTTGKIWVGDSNTVESTVIHLDESNNRLGINNNSPNYSLDVTGDANISSNVIIGGNLTVDGTQTILNTQTVEVEDNILQLNTTQGSPDTATATTSGISIYRGDGVTQASFIFDDADDTWDLTNNLVVTSSASDIAFFKSSQTTTTNVYITNTNATANNTANLYFAPANNIAGSYIKSTAIEDFSTSANRTSDLRFGVRKDGTFNEAVIINSSGDVDIAGDVTISDVQPRFRFNETDTTNENFEFRHNGGDLILDKIDDDFSSNRVERMRIDTSGNVGIGTSSPGTKLHIDGGDLRVRDSGNVAIQIVSSDSGQSAIQFGDDGDTNDGRIVYMNTTDLMRFFTNDSEKMVIDSSGNVGIGIDAPTTYYSGADNLVVYQASGEAGITVATATDTTGALYFADGTTGNEQYRGGIAYTHSTDKLSLVSGGSTKMTIDSSGDSTFYGDVIIENNFPTITLKSTDNSAVAEDIVSSIDFYAGDTSSAGQAINAKISSYATDAFGRLGLQFLTGGNGVPEERMRITSGGNVGIGTDSPDAKLSVNGIIRATTSDYASPSTGGAISMFQDNNNYATIWAVKDYNQGWADVTLCRLGGNVGIGTASPNAKLDIAAATPTLRLTNTTDPLGTADVGAIEFFTNDSSTSASRIISSIVCYNNSGSAVPEGELIFKTSLGGGGAVAATERMRIDSSGHIYQGTVGEAANKYYYFQNSTTADAGLVFKDNASTNSGYLTYNHGLDAMKFGVNGSERMRITSGGEIGIGTTNPQTDLHIAQSVNNTPTILRLENADQTIETNQEVNTIQFYTNDTSTAGTGITSKISQVAENAGNEYAMAFYTYNSGDLLTERMRIDNGGSIHQNYISGLAGTSDYGFTIAKQIGYSQVYFRADTTSTRYIQRFYNDNSGTLQNVGNIIMSGSSTSYATSSDYRLKEDLQNFAGLDIVSKIPVYDFKWKTDKSRSYGVMAHELQEVLPQAVVGGKDAEEMQGVDYSKIVPLLVKSIQELKAEIETLKTQINN